MYSCRRLSASEYAAALRFARLSAAAREWATAPTEALDWSRTSPVAPMSVVIPLSFPMRPRRELVPGWPRLSRSTSNWCSRLDATVVDWTAASPRPSRSPVRVAFIDVSRSPSAWASLSSDRAPASSIMRLVAPSDCSRWAAIPL